jgi:2-amino-4-hydroxy-6-hydroxymethyldihydropteridine diphosphokinase
MDAKPLTIIHLALGTNLGNRTSNLRRALAAFPPAVTVLVESSVYETPPWGMTDQPPFLNMVIKGETRLAPTDLLQYLKQIESELGRVPSVRYGPRLIDVDILFYNSLILDTPELTIPHPRLHERAFVLVPLADLSPTLVHPVLGIPVSTLLARVDTKGIVRHE